MAPRPDPCGIRVNAPALQFTRGLGRASLINGGMTNLFAAISASGLDPTHKVKALATRGLMQGCTGPISRQPRHPSPTSRHETPCHCTFLLVQGLSVIIRFPRGFVHTGVSLGTSTSEMLLGFLRCLSSQGPSGRAQLPGRLTAPTWCRPGPCRRPGGSSCPPLASRRTPNVLLCQGGPPIVRPDPPTRAGNPLSRSLRPPRQGPQRSARPPSYPVLSLPRGPGQLDPLLSASARPLELQTKGGEEGSPARSSVLRQSRGR
ncbi:hypothetical protein NDU88_000184 [Pleurodeles waltl]|uniref:Uncharacterized protein n=1 Tax=Pleurodeles waltl TaxID=8319 RepID=A0AAV7LZI1_PLEWA|nr:hypothetical protein NDU88_000184 [Pleurodeles waltl]